MLADTSARASVISPVAPTHTLQNNTAVAANKSVSPVASGASTTVPTDATRVQLAVSVSGELGSGILLAYPNGFPAGAGGSLAFTANTSASATILVAPGMSNKVTFLNQSAGSLKLTVKITGYTTDVYATDINGAGGSAGQVLTNTGTGAEWRAAVPPLSFVPISLINGWVPYTGVGGPVGTPGVAVGVDGVVHFHGGISCASCNHNPPVAFIVPVAMRPSQVEYLTADEYGATTGRIQVDPDGSVLIYTDANDLTTSGSDAGDFTSLAGISYTLPY
jgi:hypothetical protein